MGMMKSKSMIGGLRSVNVREKKYMKNIFRKSWRKWSTWDIKVFVAR